MYITKVFFLCRSLLTTLVVVLQLTITLTFGGQTKTMWSFLSLNDLPIRQPSAI
jgi:hypothetical protein